MPEESTASFAVNLVVLSTGLLIFLAGGIAADRTGGILHTVAVSTAAFGSLVLVVGLFVASKRSRTTSGPVLGGIRSLSPSARNFILRVWLPILGVFVAVGVVADISHGTVHTVAQVVAEVIFVVALVVVFRARRIVRGG